MSAKTIKRYAEHRNEIGLPPIQKREIQLKTYATFVPIWEGDTLQYVQASCEENAAARRGEIELENDPTTAGCFETGIEIQVCDASTEDEPSHFRVYTTSEPTFHAQRTDE